MSRPKWFRVLGGENIYNIIFRLLTWSKQNKRTAMAKVNTFNADAVITAKPNDTYASVLDRYMNRVKIARKKKSK